MKVDINLNIHYSLPDEFWKELDRIYRELPGWNGYDCINKIPSWFNSESIEGLCASVEPGGLQISGEVDEEDFKNWIKIFITKTPDLLGYQVGKPEEGFSFPDSTYTFRI